MLRFDWLKSSEETNYSGSGRNIFRAEVEIPKPVVRPKPTPVVQHRARRLHRRLRPSI